MISVTGMATPISTRTDKVESLDIQKLLLWLARYHTNAVAHWRLLRCNLGRKNQTVLNQGDLPRRKIIYCTDHTELFLGYHFRQNRSCLL